MADPQTGFQYIKLPDGSYGKFTADASDDFIRSSIQKDFPESFRPGMPKPPNAIQQEIDRRAANPTAGLPGGTSGAPAVAGPTALAAGIGGLGLAAGVANAPALYAAGKAAVKAAPYFLASEGINLARQHIPGGHLIPPGAEMLPFFMGGGKGEVAGEAAGKAAAEESAVTKGAPVYRDATLNKRNIPEYAGEDIKDIVDTHVLDQATALRTKSKIDFHLQRGDVAGAEAALDEAAGKTNPDYKPPAQRTTPANEEDAWKQATQAANEALQQGERRHPELNINYSGPERRAQAAQGPVEYGLNPEPAEDLGNKVREQTEKTMGPIKRAKKVTPEQQAAPLGNIPPRANLPSVYEQTQPPAPYKPVRQIQAESRAVPTSPENLEDHAIQQEMAADLEKHGRSAESEARREFIARNSTGTTKGELIRKSRIEKPAAEEEDLTESWTKELERRKRLKGNQPE